MSTPLQFVKGHWLTLLLLAGSVVLVSWIVQTQRPPGAMTLVEAQAMDMTAMKPPPGVFPVGVEEATERQIGDAATFPAEVLAYTDEDVVARVMGRVQKVLVYPGDKVHAGQLLATLQADEVGAMAAESSLMASSKADMARAAGQMSSENRSMLAKARAEVRAATAGVARAEADLEAMAAEREKAQREVEMAGADLEQAQAGFRYAEQEFGRSQKLHKQGAISLDELQSAQRERDSSAAMVRAAQAKVRAAEADTQVADRRARASGKMLEESQAMMAAAEAERRQAETRLLRSATEARSAGAEARSARAGAAGAAAMADYRNLRALSAGEVAERMVSPGTAVMPGMVVLKLKSLGRARVQAEVPQAMASKLRVGDPVDVIGDGVEREARLTSIFPAVMPESRTVRIEAVVDNADRALLPGMFARLRLRGPEGAGVLAVRSAAVQEDLDGSRFVWVVNAKKETPTKTDWTCTMHPEVSMPGPGLCPKCKMDLVPREGSSKFQVARREVKIGKSDGTYIEILDGLKHFEKVVWAGQEDLYPGAPVQPSEWGLNGPKSLPSPAGAQGGDKGGSEHEGHDMSKMEGGR